MVFKRLFAKFEQERQSLGGKAFDILGKVSFDNKPLRELLVEAIRYGNDPEVQSRLNQVVDKSLDTDALAALLDERALTEDTMDVHRVAAIREDMERMEAHKLQPHFVESFFVAAFASLGGRMRKRETDRYEITSVPFAVRNRDALIGFGEPVMARYERICFDKAYQNVQGKAPADLICPGHPLLEAVIDIIREQSVDTMKQGTVFIDDNDYSDEARLLFYIESSIQDGRINKDGSKRVISQNLHFVELDKQSHARNAGYAPYLDYRAPNFEERKAVTDFIPSQGWLSQGIEDLAQSYAISEIIPQHFHSVESRRLESVKKTQKAVTERLTSAIQYWDYRAGELQRQERAGKRNARLNSQKAAARAEELAARLEKRLAELEQEKLISPMPPIIVGGALIVPRGLLNRLMGIEVAHTFSPGEKSAVEQATMRAVEKIERRMGHIPHDVSRENRGYDIESKIPDENGGTLKFIEVKGRRAGSLTVTVTSNEILTSFNQPDKYILAVVEVDGKKTTTTHMTHPFHEKPEWTACSVNYNIRDLRQNSEITIENEVQYDD